MVAVHTVLAVVLVSHLGLVLQPFQTVLVLAVVEVVQAQVFMR
jgi:hypothetical protein